MHLESTHAYLLEVLREPSGELLQQEPWHPPAHLLDETRYEAACRGRLPDEPDQLIARLEPLYGAQGEPYVDRLQMTLGHRRLPEAKFVTQYTNAMVSMRGRELAAQLIKNEVLKEGDQYRIRLTTLLDAPASYSPRQELPGIPEDGRPRASHTTDADGSSPDVADPDELDELIEQPFPVGQHALQGWGIGTVCLEAADSDRPVLIHRRLLGEAVDDAICHGNQETGTLLLGQLVEDPTFPCQAGGVRWVLVVSEQVRVEDGAGTISSFTFPPESFRRARQLADLRGQGETVVGSQHSHGWRCHACELQCEIRNLFFSSHDEQMAQQFPVYGAFLVVGGDPDRDRDRPVVNLYVRHGGVMRQVPYGVFG